MGEACLKSIFVYNTPKYISIHSVCIGFISRLIQLTILCYIVGYVIIYSKGYQEFSEVESAVTTKVKGVAFTNFPDDDFNLEINDTSLYRRLWDVADYVIPPNENGAAFVATNILITPNQKQGLCPEDIKFKDAWCDPENNTCTPGKIVPFGNGPMTGRCIEYAEQNYTCEIHSWCPLEVDVMPLKNGTALLGSSKDFTILIKNFVHFPKFKDSARRNIKDTSNKLYLESCHYNKEENPECPVFRIGDIINWTNQDFDSVASKGAVIGVVINWDCNLDYDKKYCFPTYSFRRLDDPQAKLAQGWNFRYSNIFNDSQRTLYKVYGVKFSIIVQGQARMFRIVPLLLNVGAGLGLLAVEVVICDFLILYITERKEYYKVKKYEETS